MAPPTTAVWCRSFLQSDGGAVVAENGVPVGTALVTTCVGCGGVEDVEAGVGWTWKAPMEDLVTLGAMGLLQQLCRSSGVRQQYVP